MGDALTGIAIPVVVFVLMVIVGTGLVPDDFRRVLRYPAAVLVGTIGQAFLVPVMAVGLVMVLATPRETAAAVLIVALCPGGILSNFYCALAGKNVALSVTLTAVSSLTCIVTIPVVGTALLFAVQDSISTSAVPLGTIVMQLLQFLLVPIVIGLVLRHRFAHFMGKTQQQQHVLGLVLILLIVALSMWEERAVLLQSLAQTALPAVAFTVAALIFGLGLSAIAGIRERSVVAIELSVRNIPIALLIGISLDQPAMLSFSVAYFLLHAPIVLGFALINRRLGGAAK